MSQSVSGEEREATELLDETQRLRHKRDLLTKENEQLKSYLRLRQMESTATCEQLKSEIEQQIEQFEALGDQSFNDSQTSHLETLKSFRSEIEAIQCWNAKIRNKYFSRTSPDTNRQTIANQITDELIDQMVSAAASGHTIDSNNTCDNGSNDVVEDNGSEDLNADKHKKAINRKTNTKSKNNCSQNLVKNLDKTNERITRSKQKSINDSLDKKRKIIDKNTDKTTSKRSKRKRN